MVHHHQWRPADFLYPGDDDHAGLRLQGAEQMVSCIAADFRCRHLLFPRPVQGFIYRLQYCTICCFADYQLANQLNNRLDHRLPVIPISQVIDLSRVILVLSM